MLFKNTKIGNKMKQYLFIILPLLTNYLYAQEYSYPEELITDRPDATESPSVMSKGFLQIETGSFYEEFDYGDVKEKAFTFNTTLLRYGLLENLELRLGWDFQEITTQINGAELPDIQSGFTPLLVGAKVGITEENGILPKIGLLGHLYLPLAAGQDYRPETTGVDFRFAFDHTLNERSSIAYNLGAQWGDDSSEAAYIYTLVYGISLTNKLGAYAELYGDLPENSTANHYWDAGFTYLVNGDFQLDATVGSGIDNEQRILLSAGFSYRIKN